MRMMLRCYMDNEAGNKAIIDGSLPKIIGRVSEMIKPEAAYFYPDNGGRSCMMVFNLEDTSDLPRILEPLFIDLKAEVEIFPVMNAGDLEKGFGKLQQGR